MANVLKLTPVWDMKPIMVINVTKALREDHLNYHDLSLAIKANGIKFTEMKIRNGRDVMHSATLDPALAELLGEYELYPTESYAVLFKNVKVIGKYSIIKELIW